MMWAKPLLPAIPALLVLTDKVPLLEYGPYPLIILMPPPAPELSPP